MWKRWVLFTTLFFHSQNFPLHKLVWIYTVMKQGRNSWNQKTSHALDFTDIPSGVYAASSTSFKISQHFGEHFGTHTHTHTLTKHEPCQHLSTCEDKNVRGAPILFQLFKNRVISVWVNEWSCVFLCLFEECWVIMNSSARSQFLFWHVCCVRTTRTFWRV